MCGNYFANRDATHHAANAPIPHALVGSQFSVAQRSRVAAEMARSWIAARSRSMLAFSSLSDSHSSLSRRPIFTGTIATLSNIEYSIGRYRLSGHVELISTKRLRHLLFSIMPVLRLTKLLRCSIVAQSRPPFSATNSAHLAPEAGEPTVA